MLLNKCFFSFVSRMKELNNLFNLKLQQEINHYMMGNTKTILNGNIISTAELTSKKHNETVKTFNKKKFWWMKELSEIN